MSPFYAHPNITHLSACYILCTTPTAHLNHATIKSVDRYAAHPAPASGRYWHNPCLYWQSARGRKRRSRANLYAGSGKANDRASQRKPALISWRGNGSPGAYTPRLRAQPTHYCDEELETEMARIARSSRRIAFSLVFIGVMAGTGAESTRAPTERGANVPFPPDEASCRPTD